MWCGENGKVGVVKKEKKKDARTTWFETSTRPENGGVLQGSPSTRGQIPWPRARSRRSTQQRGSRLTRQDHVDPRHSTT